MSGVVHLMYGLVGSGKSTLARQLEASSPAVRFTLDEWMLRLYPALGIEEEAYGERAEEVRELIWSVAAQVLRTGSDVVLDWNSWSTARRAWAVARARESGAEVILHRMSTSLEISTRRARRRSADGAEFAHVVDRAGNAHLAALLEEPATGEGLRIQEH